MVQPNGSTVLTMKAVTKAFSGVSVLKGVDLVLEAGQVVGLLGENGAGKSTLIKILCGAYQADGGTISINDQPVRIANTKQAKALGIQAVYQELSLFPHLRVFENVFIGNELAIGPASAVAPLRTSEMVDQSQQILRDRFGLLIDVNRRVEDLTLAERQLVEIARAVRSNAKILVLDEPTTTLELREKQQLFKVISDLKSSGTAIIFISHHLEEVKEICDRTVVLRDGAVVLNELTERLTARAMVTAMSGAAPDEQYPKVAVDIGNVVLKVDGLTRAKSYSDVSFDLRAGEILGIVGLVGCGKGDLVRSIYGALRPDSGAMQMSGRPLIVRKVSDALARGLSYLPPDRKTESIFPDHDVVWNMTITALRSFSGSVGLKRNVERKAVVERVGTFGVRLSGVGQNIGRLSGGNQQKVLLARSLMNDPTVLLLEEPTRGVDVTAKRDIYQLISEFVARGRSVILVSSEETEVLGMSDRILVMREGRVRAELKRENATLDQIRLISMSDEL